MKDVKYLGRALATPRDTLHNNYPLPTFCRQTV